MIKSSLTNSNGWQAQIDRGAARASINLGKFPFGAGEADVEPFDFAEPSFAFGLGDAGDEVVADLGESVALGGVGPEHRTADACMFVDAWGAEGAATGSGGYLAT
jgi:hypothetical protein